MSKAQAGRGFTLIELLVVLVVAGLIIGLVSSIAGPDQRAQLRLEAERLAQLLDLAAAQARLTGKSVGWTSDGAGYRFWRIDEDANWSEIRDSDLLRVRTLPPGMTVSGLRVENMPSRGGMRLEFVPYSVALSFFTIEMSFDAERYSVAGSPLGSVRAAPVGVQANGGIAQR